MKIEICENTFWLSLWVSIAFIFASIILMSLIYSDATNEKILKADTCEKVMAIDGSRIEKYILCMKDLAK